MKPAAPASQQIELAQAAASGERDARKQVNEMIHPVIDYHNNRFCKRFCDQHRIQYRCTLSKPWGSASEQALLCEWGNASYGWMLDDLTNPERLQKYQARNDAGLFDYLYRIANSLPFYERWKDWRFGRKVHVPTYIVDIDTNAKAIFYALQSGSEPELIAQKLGLSLNEVQRIVHRIMVELTRRHRLYLLDPPVLQSMTQRDTASGEDDSSQMDVAVSDETWQEQDQRAHINQAWQKLDVVEQFVVEALVIDDLDAKQVLHALCELDIEIKQGVRPEDTSVQQLYYFKRKALAKLGQVLEASR